MEEHFLNINCLCEEVLYGEAKELLIDGSNVQSVSAHVIVCGYVH